MAPVSVHQVLVEHLPVPRWFGWRLTCGRCGGRYPCCARRQALDDLAVTLQSQPLAP
jgi:hypothetical protein